MSSDRKAFVKPPPAETGMRIGLLGGSFNPPHDGHRHVSLEAMKRLELDQVWWLVTPGNPLKDHGDLAPLADRMQLAEQLADHPRIVITGFEADLGTPYTVETLEFLRSRYPDVRFVWIMGADNLAGFDRWRGWREIMQLMPIAVVDRPGWRLKAEASKAAVAYAAARLEESEAARLPGAAVPAWCLLTIRLSPLSSSELRRRAKAIGRE